MPLVCCGINPNKEKCHQFVVESTQTKRNAISLLWNQPKQGEMPLVCCGINPNKEKCHQFVVQCFVACWFSFFFQPLFCQSFCSLQILNTPLVSSNASYYCGFYTVTNVRSSTPQALVARTTHLFSNFVYKFIFNNISLFLYYYISFSLF